MSFLNARAGTRGAAMLLMLAVMGYGGCGDENEPAPDDAGGGGIELVVTLDPDGPDGKVEEINAELSCDDSSEEPECVAARDLTPADIAPRPTDQACTELFGGPDEATIEGTLSGAAVAEDLTRANGCEIERFDAAVPLLQALFEGYEPGALIG